MEEGDRYGIVGPPMAADLFLEPDREEPRVVESGHLILEGHFLQRGGVFMPGHRIRLDVSSSNFPRFDVNPNTGAAVGRERRRVVADNTVFHERGRESRVVLPIIPIERGRFR